MYQRFPNWVLRMVGTGREAGLAGKMMSLDLDILFLRLL